VRVVDFLVVPAGVAAIFAVTVVVVVTANVRHRSAESK
jgi:hypothetical protein